MKKKTEKVTYGKTFRYTSTEQAIKDLTKLAKKQREEKAKREAAESRRARGEGGG